jgi:histidine ammonia-lyase
MAHHTLQELAAFIASGATLELNSDDKQRILACREYLDKKMALGGDPVYGINTGFGALCNTVVADDELGELQRNLLLSHACGMGEEVPQPIVKWMILLKIKGLARGHSGVQLATVQRLVDFYNLGICPIVYQQGSLGASGDLAPLAHLALPLIGEGEVFFKGVRMPAKEALKSCGLEPIKLQSKEGLALINGTQFMSSFASHILTEFRSLWDKIHAIAAMSLDAFMGRPEPFLSFTHEVRNHKGQVMVAKTINDLIQGSEIQKVKKEHVQDAYCFRCMPQVHGATWDTYLHCLHVLETEINSVTDNPIIFPSEDKIISGGNFHGQPLAFIMDFFAIALAELGSISERRTYKLISGQRGLQPFLAKDPGLNSGLMISQYTAASIVSQNKQLCTPASVDTIDSSNGQEDHVSMGANAATKCLRILENVKSIVGIELLTASQALDFRRPLKSSPQIESFHQKFRSIIPFIENDIYLKPAMDAAREMG